jgi:hypothetical protein
MLGAGLRPPRDLGERAAIEAIRHTLVLAKDERAIFVTEDDRLLTGTYVVLDVDRERMISITEISWKGSKKRNASIRPTMCIVDWPVVALLSPATTNGRLRL